MALSASERRMYIPFRGDMHMLHAPPSAPLKPSNGRKLPFLAF